jgi:hypothetical protein
VRSPSIDGMAGSYSIALSTIAVDVPTWPNEVVL